MFDIFYNKNNNTALFEYLEKNGFSDIQNYIPLYSNFFSLDENNYNNINLNNRYSISNIVNRNNYISLINLFNSPFGVCNHGS